MPSCNKGCDFSIDCPKVGFKTSIIGIFILHQDGLKVGHQNGSQICVSSEEHSNLIGSTRGTDCCSLISNSFVRRFPI